MNVAYELLYLIRWLIFFVRWVLTFIYALLQFISKPGSRWLVPIAVAAFLIFGISINTGHRLFDPWIGPTTVGIYDMWHGAPSLVEQTQRRAALAYYGYVPMTDAVLVTFVLLFSVVFAAAYHIVSHILTHLLGAFPKMTRPLRPYRRLQATRNNFTSAAVTIAVPKFRR